MYGAFVVVTEAIRRYLAGGRIRPEVMQHLERSIEENRRLGELLAG